MESQTRIDECLSVRNGHLFIEDCDTTDIVKRFGSPLFVISEPQLRRNYRKFKDTFAHRWTDGEVHILPAFKANSVLATRSILTQEGAGADIYSEGELFAALKMGVAPDLISVNGGGKSESMIRECVKAGVRITVEDIDEPDLINRIAEELGETAKIRFRVKPDFPNLWRLTDFAQEFASIDLGLQVYKSAIPNEYLPELGQKVLRMKNLELTGFHFHGGRHSSGLWFWKGLMEQYGKLIADLCRQWNGYIPKEIDIGGGFAAPRDPMNKLGLRKDVVITFLGWPFQLLLKLLGKKLSYRLTSAFVEKGMVKKTGGISAPSIQEYADVTISTLTKVLHENNIDTSGVALQVEPGRALYGDAGIHLASVKKVKKQTRPISFNWILTDTTQFFMSTNLMDYTMNDFKIANKTDAVPGMVADIVGHSCAGDRILPLVKVPDLAPGDIIAILDTGAYHEVSASNFNALPRPATVLVNGKEAEVVRKADKIEDIYIRDIIPERLKGSGA